LSIYLRMIFRIHPLSSFFLRICLSVFLSISSAIVFERLPLHVFWAFTSTVFFLSICLHMFSAITSTVFSEASTVACFRAFTWTVFIWAFILAFFEHSPAQQFCLSICFSMFLSIHLDSFFSDYSPLHVFVHSP
jgi:hypothetical protein